MIEILHNDNDIIICIKPAGTISEFNEKSPISLPAILMRENEIKEIFCVHRLDKEVSGIIVYAKNAKSAAELTSQITEGVFKKQYIVAIHGRPECDEGTLTDLLYHDRAKNKTYVVKRDRRGVKRAELHYNLHSFDDANNVSILRIELLTGRTHQIRVQFASRGMSVLGDRKYGAADNIKPIRLHSAGLSFFSPTDRKEISFYSMPEWS